MSGNQRQGVAFIYVNGRELETLPGTSFTPAGDKRETVKGSRVYGYKSAPREATLECKIPGGGDIGLDEIMNWTDITAEFRADTGESWMMPNAWQTDDPQNSDGDITIKLASKTSKRIA